MKYFSAILALATSAAAFAPASVSKSSTALNAVDLEGMAGSTKPLPKFDPLGLANVGSEETFRWFQAAELKHSRCAMVAVTGFIVQAAGMHFPGMLSSDISFESLSGMNPVDQWAAVPDAGKWQIIGTILIAEIATEAQGTHYMKGGEFPTWVIPSIEVTGIDEETMKTKRSRELNNGRLSMISIMAFISEHSIPGSVPGLGGISDVF